MRCRASRRTSASSCCHGCARAGRHLSGGELWDGKLDIWFGSQLSKKQIPYMKSILKTLKLQCTISNAYSNSNGWKFKQGPPFSPLTSSPDNPEWVNARRPLILNWSSYLILLINSIINITHSNASDRMKVYLENSLSYDFLWHVFKFKSESSLSGCHSYLLHLQRTRQVHLGTSLKNRIWVVSASTSLFSLFKYTLNLHIKHREHFLKFRLNLSQTQMKKASSECFYDLSKENINFMWMSINIHNKS